VGYQVTRTYEGEDLPSHVKMRQIFFCTVIIMRLSVKFQLCVCRCVYVCNKRMPDLGNSSLYNIICYKHTRVAFHTKAIRNLVNQ